MSFYLLSNNKKNVRVHSPEGSYSSHPYSQAVISSAPAGLLHFLSSSPKSDQMNSTQFTWAILRVKNQNLSCIQKIKKRGELQNVSKFDNAQADGIMDWLTPITTTQVKPLGGSGSQSDSSQAPSLFKLVKLRLLLLIKQLKYSSRKRWFYLETKS